MKLAHNMRAKSVRILGAVETGLKPMMTAWLLLAMAACALRVLVSPMHQAPDLSTVLPYILLVGGPLVSMGLALRWFANGDQLAQPETRIARIGRWRDVDKAEAKAHRLYGPTGLMVSLLIGILLNVPVRAMEYLAAMPALAGQVPHWLSTLRFAMTLDVVLLSCLYTVSFVAALRRVPLFPRLLATTWVIDLTMQLVIAQAVVSAGGMPASVGTALHTILDGNVKKVLISVVIWLPYLLISERVNVTYRNRVSAR
nr:DUF2569 domain-containing protein [uncultured Sphingomonas sp.]